jgi:hypothetical protein
MKIQLNLTNEQLEVVMQSLDIAVKTGGLNAAPVVLPVAIEIQKQVKQEEPPSSDA